MELQQRFSTLLFNYTKDKNLIASLWKDIEIHYTEKHRTYHNLQHLIEIFSYLDLYKDELEQPNIVTFSFFLFFIMMLFIRFGIKIMKRKVRILLLISCLIL